MVLKVYEEFSILEVEMLALNFVKYKVPNAVCMHQEFRKLLHKKKKVKVGLETNNDLVEMFKVIILFNTCFDRFLRLDCNCRPFTKKTSTFSRN